MKPAFAAEATIFSSNDGAPSGGAISGLFDCIDTAFKATPESRYAIAFIDITGTAAGARVDNNDSSVALPVPGVGRATWLLDLMRSSASIPAANTFGTPSMSIRSKVSIPASAAQFPASFIISARSTPTFISTKSASAGHSALLRARQCGKAEIAGNA